VASSSRGKRKAGVSSRGISPALRTLVELYDISEDGFHTPLSEAQIGDLFRAGHLKRCHRCKLATRRDWRTIDELFPLLKYDSRVLICPSKRRSPDTVLYASVGALIVLALCGVAVFWLNERSPSARPPEFVFNPVSQQPNAAQDNLEPMIRKSSQDAAHNQSIIDAERRAAEGRRLAQAAQSQIAAADQRRAELDRPKKESEEFEGKDRHVPLDQFSYIQMNGGGVWVKIHDNDVTNFNVWVNGGFLREVPKEKGMTHSRTDETLIYGNGRSSLYYVWQISGKLDHCLLRVRDN
jgi:hypothetical protein